MDQIKALVLRHFELVVVVVLVLATAFAVFSAPTLSLAFLNFFYIPTLIAAYFLGRRQGVFMAVAGVLMVGIYAVIRNADAMSSNLPLPGVALWGVFIIVTAFVVGTLYDVKNSAVQDLRQAYQGILAILAKFIDAVDSYTQEHSMRVSVLAAEVAEHMGLPEDDVESVRVAGLLHDIGKIDISLDVLRKASVLNDSEWALVRTHPTKGTALLKPVGGLLSDVVPLVECHHECYDGTGYLSKKGDEIPLGARILAVADSYDTMVCDRPYRTGRTPAEALKEVERCGGTQFDPTVVTAFKAVMHRKLDYA